jgi:hypothetical protein
MRGLGQTCPAGQTWVPMPTPTNLLNGQCIPTDSFNTATEGPLWAPTTATITNVSRPGQSFQVGDSWSLLITGTPGVAVVGTASQNGAAPSSSNFETTNESGQLTLTGTFGAGDVGTWSESWLVGSGSPYTISFSVANPVTPPANVSQPVGPAIAATATTGVDLSFLTNTVSIFGMNIPVWGLIAAGLGLVVVSKDL